MMSEERERKERKRPGRIAEVNKESFEVSLKEVKVPILGYKKGHY